jgi:hypothetical protein
MYISRWWCAFLTTFDRNHDRKCGKSLTLKASSIRNLFHQDRRWMENSIATVWGDCGKTYGANFQSSGATTPGPCFMTTLRLTCRSLYSSFWLLRIRQSSHHPPYSLGLVPCDFFLFQKMKLKPRERRFDGTEEIQTESQDVLKKLTRNDLQQCFRSWKSRWYRCINAEGGYFEWNGGE